MKSTTSFENRKLKTSYISVIISMSLVLFLLGLLAILFMSAKQLSNTVKEQFTIHIFLKKNSSETQIKNLKKTLKIADYTNSLKYTSSQEATKEYIQTTGENFIEFLGDNPILSNFAITVKAEIVNPNMMAKLAQELKEYKIVEEVDYQKDILENYFSKLDKATYWILAIISIFLLIFIALINSSVRLAIYAKRFIIKTMQLVGATKSFIQRPFLIQSIWLGIISSIIAISLLSLSLYYFLDKIELLDSISNEQYLYLAILYVLILSSGVLMAYTSTYLATQRFLKLKTDQLY